MSNIEVTEEDRCKSFVTLFGSNHWETFGQFIKGEGFSPENLECWGPDVCQDLADVAIALASVRNAAELRGEIRGLRWMMDNVVVGDEWHALVADRIAELEARLKEVERE